MNISRRTLLHLATGVVALPTSSRAQTYPSRPVHLIVPFPAGSSPDIIGRLISQSLSQRLGQQFVVENRPGASTNIATEHVVRSNPDGYTLLWVTAPNAINVTLYENLNFDFIKDITPVGAVMRVPNVMVVNPSVPVTTLPEFIAYAKERPEKINMASSGNGTTDNLSGQLFDMMTGIMMVSVAYRGGYFADLLSGEMQVAFPLLPATMPHIKSGKLRALAVTTTSRWEDLPDVPSLSEFVPNYDASSWFGLGGPKGTVPDVVKDLTAQSMPLLPIRRSS
jgi:tripartite-type tricarboxylate transporter receptor subunit TctC